MNSTTEKAIKVDLSVREKIDKALELKNEGNTKFKEMDYQTAIKRYHNALLFVKGLGDRNKTMQALAGGSPENKNGELSEENKKMISDLEFMCYNNLSACLLKKERYERAFDYADKALEIEPGNIKALFRRGTASFNLKKFGDAEKDFKEIQTLNPKEKSVDKYLKEIQAQKRKTIEKQKEMYSKMF